MGGSSCGKVFVAVAASVFGPVVMTDRILKRRQGQWQSNHESREMMTGRKRRYDRDGEKLEERHDILFQFVSRVDRDAVNLPPPPSPPLTSNVTYMTMKKARGILLTVSN